MYILQEWKNCALPSLVFQKLQQNDLTNLHLYVQVSRHLLVGYIEMTE